MIPKGVYVHWMGKGFGDIMSMAQLTGILCDNNIDSILLTPGRIRMLLDIPCDWQRKEKGYFEYNGNFTCTHSSKNLDEPWLIQRLHYLENIFQKKLYFDREKRGYVPVIYKEIVSVPSVDVVLCTSVNDWAVCRNWPYFDALKEKFDKVGITYKDLNKDKVWNFECLNYVKKAKVYLGLDTGTSHYVSKYANGKGCIINSGYQPFYMWAYPYNYKVISVIVDCEYRPCFFSKRDEKVCPYDFVCMRRISVNTVFNEIVKMLE